MNIIPTKEILPPETSMTGKNTCYLHCPALNRRSNYGVCLYTLRAEERGALHSDSDCSASIRRGECVAIKYRQQERDEGRALFYQPREEKVVEKREYEPPLAYSSSSAPRDVNAYRRGQMMVDSRFGEKRAVRAPEKKKAISKDVTEHISGSLSDALTSAFKRDQERDALDKQKALIREQIAQSQSIVTKGSK